MSGEIAEIRAEHAFPMLHTGAERLWMLSRLHEALLLLRHADSGIDIDVILNRLPASAHELPTLGPKV